ncbi:hypothetical protein N7495_006393 [Penicillium taxi]|uniref:uncharacterized protein n=1 Tax=Penicillium taxi TaxID=168475 RepID=UPI0025459A03|nr:uncharacterized protein N7495_006393 [Penicillium taxi]KAJ5894702.1 hypothetical protein N7495_006393 [Penicillium taxi]
MGTKRPRSSKLNELSTKQQNVSRAVDAKDDVDHNYEISLDGVYTAENALDIIKVSGGFNQSLYSLPL